MIANCPICDAQVTLPKDAQVSEVITCSECKSKLVIESLDSKSAILAEAPAVEEDWGE